MQVSAAILAIGGATYESRVQLWWEADTNINPRNFEIYRGETRDKVTERIGRVTGEVGKRVYTFDDFTAKLRDRFRPYYYQIAYGTGSGTTFTEEGRSEKFSWDTHYRIEEEAIIAAQELMFHYDMGSPVFIYSERTTSLRCENCWDIATSTANPSLNGCPICMGTGRVTPYLDPYAVWMDFGVTDRSLMIREFGEHDPGEKMIRFNGVPRIKPGDIILEPFTQGIWLVNRIKPCGRTNAPVMVMGTISLLDKSDPVYQFIRVSESDMRDLQTEMDAIDEERRH